MNARTPRRRGEAERSGVDGRALRADPFLSSDSLLSDLRLLASWRSNLFVILAALSLPLLAGCFGKPNQTNIALRKQAQTQQDQIDRLKQQLAAQQAETRGLQQHMPTVPVLPPERLKNLFTTHGLKFGKLTSGIDTDPKKPGDEAVKVYVVPTDQEGQPIKASGTFTFDLYDLAQPDASHIGHWTFDVEQARQNWYGTLLDYTYAFTLPWQTVPKHADLAIHVTFLDELTQIPFEAQTTVKVHVPPATQP